MCVVDAGEIAELLVGRIGERFRCCLLLVGPLIQYCMPTSTIKFYVDRLAVGGCGCRNKCAEGLPPFFMAQLALDMYRYDRRVLMAVLESQVLKFDLTDAVNTSHVLCANSEYAADLSSDERMERLQTAVSQQSHRTVNELMRLVVPL